MQGMWATCNRTGRCVDINSASQIRSSVKHHLEWFVVSAEFNARDLQQPLWKASAIATSWLAEKTLLCPAYIPGNKQEPLEVKEPSASVAGLTMDVTEKSNEEAHAPRDTSC